MTSNIDAALRRPLADEYFEYYDTYVSKVPEGKCWALLNSQIQELSSFFKSVSEQEASTVHEPYSWTIKQVVGHLIDTERIFAERLHHFAFGDLQPLPGMDQEAYVSQADYQTPKLVHLVDEMLLLRSANRLLIQRIRPEDFDRRGVASDKEVTVRALAWMLVGHVIYHKDIVHKRLGR